MILVFHRYMVKSIYVVFVRIVLQVKKIEEDEYTPLGTFPLHKFFR